MITKAKLQKLFSDTESYHTERTTSKTENGNGEATFDLSLRTAFKVVENSSSKYSELGFGAETSQENIKEKPKKTTSKTTQKTTQKPPRNHPEKAKEKPKKHPRNIQETSKKHPRNIQEIILDAINDNPSITRKELEVLSGSSHGSIKHHISQLVKNNVIKREGSTKGGKWVIL